MSMYEPLEDLVGDAKQGDGTIAFQVLYRLLGFRDCHYQCSSPDFWNFEVVQTERRKAINQDFSAAPAWVISSRQIESGPGAFPGFRCLRPEQTPDK